MLRWMLALVVVANLLFLAWSQHWLAPLGLGPVSQSEPQRLSQQMHPEAIVLRPARPAASASAAPQGASAVIAASAVSAPAAAASAASGQ
ncbi:MAG: hypothetical protein KAZ24_03130 [Brachymonas sp.]|jgi:hypothetical protein|nr:hypothetical protein [Brachymonas sp.]